MKKITLISLAATLTTSLWALTLDEAINIAVENNYNLQEQNYILEESKENIELKRASLMPNVDLSYSYNDRDKASSSQTKKDSTATAKLSYNLFNGFKDIKSMQSAKFLAKSSSFTLNAKTQDIVLNTKSTYINLLDQHKNLATTQDAYKLFEKQYEDAKIRFEQGLLAKNDLLQVNVNMLDAKQDVMTAKKDYQVARLELSNLLGGKDLSNVGIDEIHIKELALDKHSLEDLESRSELEALKMNIESMNALVDTQKADFYPSVDTSYSYSQFGNDMSPDGRGSYPDNQNVGTISASWNLYEGGADASQIKIYLSQKRQVLAQLDRTRLDIKLQYETALLDLDVAKQNYETSKLSLEQAKENYNIVESRYKEGLSSTTDLIDANYLLSKAKQRYSKSYYDKFLAVATLKRVLEVK